MGLISNDRPEQINVPKDTSQATNLSAGIFAQAKLSDFRQLPDSSGSASNYLHDMPMTITDSAANPGQGAVDTGTGAATRSDVLNPNTGAVFAQVDQIDGQIARVKFEDGPMAGSQIVRGTDDGTYTLKDAQGRETPLTSVNFDEKGQSISFTDTIGNTNIVFSNGVQIA